MLSTVCLKGFSYLYKSDDVTNRSNFLFSIINNRILPKPNLPHSFKTLIVELQCLCLDIKVFSQDKKSFFN